MSPPLTRPAKTLKIFQNSGRQTTLSVTKVRSRAYTLPLPIFKPPRVYDSSLVKFSSAVIGTVDFLQYLLYIRIRALYYTYVTYVRIVDSSSFPPDCEISKLIYFDSSFFSFFFLFLFCSFLPFFLSFFLPYFLPFVEVYTPLAKYVRNLIETSRSIRSARFRLRLFKRALSYLQPS